MRARRLILVSVVATSVAAAGQAAARPHLPGLLGAVFGGVGGLIGLRHARHHRYVGHHVPHDVAHAHHPRQTAVGTREEPAAESHPAGGEGTTQSAEAGPSVWPALPADLADYIFWPSGRDDSFWSYGYENIIEGALGRANRHSERMSARHSAAAGTAVASVGAAPAGCAGQQGTDVATSLIERIEQTIAPTDAQQGALAELREALRHGFEYFDAACPAGRSQSPSARLDAMEDRIWAARQAVLVIRAPLAKLYASLSDEQKAKLNGQASQPAEREATCSQTSPTLPIAHLEHRGRPATDQRAGLAALKQTSAGLAKLVADSCPSGLPATPVDRLDTADKRLNALLYAVDALRAPLGSFSASLSNAQKPRAKASR